MDIVEGRVIERAIVALGGLLALWLSYKFAALSGESDANIKWDNLQVELKKIGPSIFFALAGVVILVSVLNAKIERKIVVDTENKKTTESIRGLDGAANIRNEAMLLYKDILSITGKLKVSTPEMSDAARTLETRASLIPRIVFGQTQYDLFRITQLACNKDQASSECISGRAQIGDSYNSMVEFFK